ncbi:MAG: DoxX family membrane protein [Deltaproteobacteria bacterium]|nr:DoxX family membrane protein [Deltaproteobacteria bacterium]
MSLLRDPRLSMAFRLLVGVLFIWAGVVKLGDPAAFEEGLVNYRMLPGWSIPPVAAMLPAIEVVAGLCLVVGVAIRGAALVTTGMLVVFTAAIVQAIVRGIDIECGCFGAGSEVATTIGWPEVVRDAALLAASAHVLLYDRGVLSLQRLRERRRG